MSAVRDLIVALVAGVLQGIFEWLPISSEGNVAALLTLVGATPGGAVRYSLFLHLGTALAATVYYREIVGELVAELPDWRPSKAFSASASRLPFLGVATVVSGVVGLVAYSALEHVVSALAGGAFVAAIGVLLVGTGLFQWRAESRGSTHDGSGEVSGSKAAEDLGIVDGVLVGVLQGLAILPGVSRSGTTVGALLLRGYSGPTSFQLSFVLAIPASVGAGVLVLLDDSAAMAGGLIPALVALAASAVVGYLAIGALMGVVERVSFGTVCLGLGGVAILGGVLLI